MNKKPDNSQERAEKPYEVTLDKSPCSLFAITCEGWPLEESDDVANCDETLAKRGVIITIEGTG